MAQRRNAHEHFACKHYGGPFAPCKMFSILKNITWNNFCYKKKFSFEKNMLSPDKFFYRANSAT